MSRIPRAASDALPEQPGNGTRDKFHASGKCAVSALTSIPVVSAAAGHLWTTDFAPSTYITHNVSAILNIAAAIANTVDGPVIQLSSTASAKCAAS